MYGESKVIRLLSIIHNGIILDLVCGFSGSVGSVLPSLFFQRGRIFLDIYVAVPSRDSSGELSLSHTFPRERDTARRGSGPHWPSPHLPIGSGQSDDKLNRCPHCANPSSYAGEWFTSLSEMVELLVR